jgi:type VI secretion system protein ImpL
VPVLPTLRSGRSRFIHHLFSRVIFPEADLAGLDKRERSRIHWGQRALYVGALAALALFGMLWAGGFSANYERLENLRTLAQNWTQQRSALTARDDAMGAENPRHQLRRDSGVPEEGRRLYHERGGLYQGEDVNPVVKQAYERELEAQLLPRVATMLEGQIRANMKDRDAAQQPACVPDAEHEGPSRRGVAQGLGRHRLVAALHRQHRGAEWSEHALRALAEAAVHLPADDQLVAQARQVLRAESLATVVYRMLREQARNCRNTVSANTSARRARCSSAPNT